MTKYVNAITTVANGVIHVSTTNAFNQSGVDSTVVSLAPLTAADGVPAVGSTVNKWRCGLVADGTTMEAKYLPGSCRGN